MDFEGLFYRCEIAIGRATDRSVPAKLERPKDTRRSELGKRIRGDLRQRGLSLARVAEVLGMPAPQLSSALVGVNTISEKNLSTLEALAGVSDGTYVALQRLVPRKSVQVGCFYETFGRHIRKGRERLSMTVEALADDAEIIPNYVKKVELGGRLPRREVCERLGRSLKWPSLRAIFLRCLTLQQRGDKSLETKLFVVLEELEKTSSVNPSLRSLVIRIAVKRTEGDGLSLSDAAKLVRAGFPGESLVPLLSLTGSIKERYRMIPLNVRTKWSEELRQKIEKKFGNRGAFAAHLGVGRELVHMWTGGYLIPPVYHQRVEEALELPGGYLANLYDDAFASEWGRKLGL